MGMESFFSSDNHYVELH